MAPAPPRRHPCARASAEVEIDGSKGHLGVTLSDFPKLAGARVDSLYAADVCAKAGLRVGDVITAINGERVGSPLRAIALMQGQKGKFTLQYIPAAAVPHEEARVSLMLRRRCCQIALALYLCVVVILLLHLAAMIPLSKDGTLHGLPTANEVWDHLRSLVVEEPSWGENKLKAYLSRYEVTQKIIAGADPAEINRVRK
ncbi:hypothetical protein AB1Y20_009067 [Prymnesium parvum]|uniref:PDZ domain-containing protein n=1 Tax=Prymnesium parvum TaxID=97485 RepID=A0AB34K3S5_PRYPA